MKKTIIVFLLAACMIMPLFAIGGRDRSTQDGITKIRVWSDNASEKALRDQQIARFNSGRGRDQGIEIDYTVYGTNFPEALDIALKAGEAPELYRPGTGGRAFADYVNANLAVPINDLPGGQDLVNLYQGELVPNQHTWDGKAYTLPYNITSYKFFINKDIFDAAGITRYPTTWDEVREAARTITQRGNGNYYGYIMGLRSSWTMTTYFLFPNGTNTGVGVFDNDRLQYNFSSHLPMVNAVMGMINDGSVFPGYENLDADQMRAQFAAGRVGMIGGASFDVGVYQDQFPVNFNMVVIDIPAYQRTGSPYREVVSATVLLAISPSARSNAAKSMEVYKFFYSDENAAEMYEQGYYIPYRSQAVALATKPPTAKGFAEFANVPQKMILLPGPDADLTLEGLVYREVFLRLFSRGYTDTPEQVLRELDTRYNTAVQRLDRALLNSYRAPADRVILRN
jgi:multiple sugar transport system substrate-binding protein